MSEKICVINTADSTKVTGGYIIEEDITEYIRNKMQSGKTTVMLLFRADETTWAEDFSGDQLRQYWLAPKGYSNSLLRPEIKWVR